MNDGSGKVSGISEVDWKGVVAAEAPKGPSRAHEVRTVVTPVLLLVAGVACLAHGLLVVGIILCVLGVGVAAFEYAIGALFVKYVLRREANVFALVARISQPGVRHRACGEGAASGDGSLEAKIDRRVGFALTRASALGGFFCQGMSEEDVARRRENVLAERTATYEWLQDGPGFTEVWTCAPDGTRLCGHAWASDAAADAWVVLCHGYAGSWDSMLQYARPWAQAGYNLLIVSMRGHGQSEGPYIGMGYLDGADVVSWAKYLCAPGGGLPAARSIVLMGHSMGAHSVLNASGLEGLPAQVCAIVADCGFDAVWSSVAGIAASLGVPDHPTLELVRRHLRHARGGYDIAADDAARMVARSRTPILFVHGLKDATVSPGCTRRLYEAATCERRVLLVEGAGHCMSSLLVPDVYWQTVLGFARAHLR